MDPITGLIGLVVGLSLSGSADNATTASALLGCDTYVVEGTNYTNKVDPTCTFASVYPGSRIVDPDGIPGSGDEYSTSDN
jgi:hypothetical protein